MSQNKSPEQKNFGWSRAQVALAVLVTAVVHGELVRRATIEHAFSQYEAMFLTLALVVASAIIGYNASRRWF